MRTDDQSKAPATANTRTISKICIPQRRRKRIASRVSHSCRVVVEYGPLIDAPGENLKRTVVAMMVYDVIPQGTGKKQRDNASVLVTTHCF